MRYIMAGQGMVRVHAEGGEDTSRALARVWDMVRCTCRKDCLGYFVEKRGRKEREQLHAYCSIPGEVWWWPG